MEGFLHFRMRPWLRRLMTRSLAIIPAIIVISMNKESGLENLLVLSQVILSLQLPFAVIPLVKFTTSRRKMGEFANGPAVAIISWLIALIIVALNAQLIGQQLIDWYRAAAAHGWLVV